MMTAGFSNVSPSGLRTSHFTSNIHCASFRKMRVSIRWKCAFTRGLRGNNRRQVNAHALRKSEIRKKIRKAVHVFSRFHSVIGTGRSFPFTEVNHLKISGGKM